MAAPRTHEEVLAHLASSRAAYQAAHAGDAPRPERVFRHALPAGERRHAVGSNGAPLSPAEALVRLGEAAYGERWKTELAADLGLSVRTVHCMADGETPVWPDVLARLRLAMERHVARVALAMVTLEASVASERDDR